VVRRKAAEAGRLWSGIDEEIQAKEITLRLCIRLSKKPIRDCGVPKPTISADVGWFHRRRDTWCCHVVSLTT